jgi:uncharacterized membrane protein
MWCVRAFQTVVAKIRSSLYAIFSKREGGASTIAAYYRQFPLEYILLDFSKKTEGGFMEKIEKSIDVECPISTVYNQWTQFEDFPRFMKGVKRVTQLDDKRLHWEAEIAGKDKEWDARITDQVPEHRISWESEGGEYTSGAVNFTAVDPNCTRVNLQLTYDPEGFVEKTGDALGVVSVESKAISNASKSSSRTGVKRPVHGGDLFGSDH